MKASVEEGRFGFVATVELDLRGSLTMKATSVKSPDYLDARSALIHLAHELELAALKVRELLERIE